MACAPHIAADASHDAGAESLDCGTHPSLYNHANDNVHPASAAVQRLTPEDGANSMPPCYRRPRVPGDLLWGRAGTRRGSRMAGWGQSFRNYMECTSKLNSSQVTLMSVSMRSSAPRVRLHNFFASRRGCG